MWEKKYITILKKLQCKKIWKINGMHNLWRSKGGKYQCCRDGGAEII